MAGLSLVDCCKKIKKKKIGDKEIEIYHQICPNLVPLKVSLTKNFLFYIIFTGLSKNYGCRYISKLL